MKIWKSFVKKYFDLYKLLGLIIVNHLIKLLFAKTFKKFAFFVSEWLHIDYYSSSSWIAYICNVKGADPFLGQFICISNIG